MTCLSIIYITLVKGAQAQGAHDAPELEKVVRTYKIAVERVNGGQAWTREAAAILVWEMGDISPNPCEISLINCHKYQAAACSNTLLVNVCRMC